MKGKIKMNRKKNLILLLNNFLINKLNFGKLIK